MRTSLTSAPAKPTTLGKVADFEMGQSPESAFVNDAGSGVPFLQGNAEFGAVFPSHRLYCERPKKLCKSGDVLISVRAPVGALNKADRAYCIGRGLAAVRFSRMLPHYGWHMLTYWAKDLRIVAQGTTFEAVGKTELANLRIVEPPLPEQRCIAEILDTADSAIGETEALISKLKHIKTGLMHDLLTRGLDERGRLRDPDAYPEQFKGSPLGRMPREWKPASITEFVRVADGIKPGPFGSSITKSTYASKGYRVYGQEQVIAGDLSVGDYYIPESKYSELRTFAVQKDDLLLSLVGTIGKVLVVPTEFHPGVINPRLIRLRPDPANGNVRFLKHLLTSTIVRQQLAQISQGGTMDVLSGIVLRRLVLPKPSLVEQQRIAEILDAHDARIRAEEAYRDKLKLQKKGLMDDLLTGRVRVKTAQEVGA